MPYPGDLDAAQVHERPAQRRQGQLVVTEAGRHRGDAVLTRGVLVGRILERLAKQIRHHAPVVETGEDLAVDRHEMMAQIQVAPKLRFDGRRVLARHASQE